jgi:hypothetical protein
MTLAAEILRPTLLPVDMTGMTFIYSYDEQPLLVLNILVRRYYHGPPSWVPNYSTWVANN